MNSVSLVGRQCSEKKENNSKNKQKRVHHLGERIGGGAKKKKIQNEQCRFGKRTCSKKKKIIEKEEQPWRADWGLR